MPQWTAFAAITGVVLVLLLVLSHLTQSAFSASDSNSDSDPSPDSVPDSTSDRSVDEASNGIDGTDAAAGDDADRADRSALAADAAGDGKRVGDAEANDAAAVEPDSAADALPGTAPDPGPDRSTRARGGPASPARETLEPDDLSTGVLLANVAVSQGLFLFVLLGAVLYTGIPAGALGIEFGADYLATGLVLGTAAGIALYVANEIGASLATRFGFDHDEQLRSLLAPDSPRGWLTLLVVVLPVIAVFEELLFRAALIGAFSVGFGVSPWELAVLSSIAFALGHGMQGSVGIAVTGALGLVLAGLFIVTGSFLVVVVAHYLINALEFVVHEALELEWAKSLESSSSSSPGSRSDK